jgi:hypothetical protein
VNDQPRWWVFDRPFARDWLFILAVLSGAISAILAATRRDLGSVARVLSPLTAAVTGFLFIGVVGGGVREFARGRTGRS